jgi:porin
MSDRISLLACVYDANPVEFPDNPYNIRWRFTVGDGVIAAAEAQISTGDENHFQDVYKIGVYNNDHFSVIDMETNIPNSVYENNYGVYFTVDQSIAGEPSTAGAVTVFVRGSVTTKQYNENYRFAGAGINYYGLFNADGSDMVGLAIARAALASTDDETAFELTYQRPVTENITFQPDIQYIVHPAGTSTVLPDAIVGTIRFGIRF